MLLEVFIQELFFALRATFVRIHQLVSGTKFLVQMMQLVSTWMRLVASLARSVQPVLNATALLVSVLTYQKMQWSDVLLSLKPNRTIVQLVQPTGPHVQMVLIPSRIEHPCSLIV